MVAIGAIISVLGGVQGAMAVECPNEALRDAQVATFLPDCRAYELISPPEGEPQNTTNEHPVEDTSIGAQASSTGGGIAWFSYYPLSGSLGGEFYNLSTRGPGGWSTEPVGPWLSSWANGHGYCRPKMFYSADLSAGILTVGKSSAGVEESSEEGECPSIVPSLVPGEPEGFQNVFLRDSATGAYTLVNATPLGVTPSDASFLAGSSDLSHVVFEDGTNLTQTAPAGARLYEWVAGAVSLVTVLPNGTPTLGAFSSAAAEVTHPVSTKGTRVIFEAEGKLFLRENVEQKVESAPGSGGECLEPGTACTVQLDASQAGGAGGGGGLLAANTTDTRIFFTDEANAKLTADTTPGSGQHLYEYDTATGHLTDLTPAGEWGGALSGISDDGSYLYVVASAALAAGATAGQPNLYVFHNGTVRFIATLATEGGQVSHAESVQESRDWNLSELTARVSPDGRYIGFNSIQRLTGYDNTDAHPGECDPGDPEKSGAYYAPCQEIFLYDAEQGVLHCVSCASPGVRPTAPAALPKAEPTSDGQGPNYLPRSVLDGGRVFFDTASPLLPQATNGMSNVYEYEGGQMSLISSGTSEANSIFYDASRTGEDAFFLTTQHLVRADTDNGMRLYDARVSGGYREPEAPAPPCSGEGCRAATAGLSGSPTLVTSGAQGSGNLSPVSGKALPRRQMLERALSACRHKKNKRKRAVCVQRAHLRYGARSSGTKRRRGK